MSSIITSIKDLVTSVFEVIVSVFHTGLDMTSGLLGAIVNSFIGALRMALRAVGNIFEAAGCLGKFIASKLCSFQ
jgi:phage-related protein